MPIPASWASGYPNAAFRYRQAGHLYIQPRDFAPGADPCKQCICPDICSNRACPRYRQAMYLSYNSRFAVTGKLGICPPNAKNDRFPEIGKRSFCLPGLLGKSLKPCMCPSAQLRDFCEIASDGKMKKRKSRDTQITQECFSPTRASLPILRSRAPARSRRSKCRLPSPRFSGFRKRAPASERVLRSRCPAAYSPS